MGLRADPLDVDLDRLDLVVLIGDVLHDPLEGAVELGSIGFVDGPLLDHEDGFGSRATGLVHGRLLQQGGAEPPLWSLTSRAVAAIGRRPRLTTGGPLSFAERRGGKRPEGEDELRSTVHAELREDRADVVLNGLRGQHEA